MQPGGDRGIAWDGLPFIGGLKDPLFLAELLFLFALPGGGLGGGGGGEEEEEEAEGEGGEEDEDSVAGTTTGLKWPWARHACECMPCGV